jgi:hypothetical protein
MRKGRVERACFRLQGLVPEAIFRHACERRAKRGCASRDVATCICMFSCSYRLLTRSCLTTPALARGRHNLHQTACERLGRDFTLIPEFLCPDEQRVLLAASLRKLNEAESALSRRKRRRYEVSLTGHQRESLFLPDEFYQFEEVSLVLTVSRTQSHPLT